MSVALVAVAAQLAPEEREDCLKSSDLAITDDFGTPITDDLGQSITYGRQLQCDLKVGRFLDVSIPLWKVFD